LGVCDYRISGMETAMLDVFGAIGAACIFSGIVTGIWVLFHKLIRRPLNKAQIISSFTVMALLCIAMIIYHRCHA
jgi:hypothetical protein